jgi:hypothetical protein
LTSSLGWSSTGHCWPLQATKMGNSRCEVDKTRAVLFTGSLRTLVSIRTGTIVAGNSAWHCR